jgi:predicted  nucleic acid-binding Zn-ribbon protein
VNTVKTGDIDNNDIDMNDENRLGYERFMSILEQLQGAQSKLALAKEELSVVESQGEKNRIVNDKKLGGSTLINNEETIVHELSNSKEILEKLNVNKSEVQTILNEKTLKRDQAKKALELQKTDLESRLTDEAPDSIRARALKKVDTELAERNKEFDMTMKRMEEEYESLSILFNGMKALNDIKELSAGKEMIINSITGMQELPITIEFQSGLTCTLILVGAGLELDRIDVITGAAHMPPSTIEKIINECKEIAPPNDLRHAVFCLGCTPFSNAILQEHAQELKKKCLVGNVTSNGFTFTIPIGVQVKIKTHMCYPNIPAGVQIESLTSLSEHNRRMSSSAFNEKELHAIVINCNSMCFGNVFALYDYITRPDVLGENDNIGKVASR